MAATPPTGSLRRRAWRWHFLAALIVVPFVLWQSITGTTYLWSYAWVDAAHADLRFVAPTTHHAPLESQLQVARDARPGSRVANVMIPADPHRSTQFNFEDARGLPVTVFVDPYTGRLLGRLDAAAWLPGWTKKLHGGWPAGKFGSILLELGACWTIVMVLTGLVLWWPRDGRSLLRSALPRLGAGPRIFWRDLHACVAVWFSVVIIAFLFTALPWTSFWGDTVLKPIQRALSQQAPRAAGFAPVVVPRPDSGTDGRLASLDAIVRNARANGMVGDLLLNLAEGRPDAAIAIRNQRSRTSEEKYALYDRHDGARVGSADWSDFPVMAKAVATGVDLHEGSYFGQAGPWLNTLFASALVWLSVTGLLSWWRRKPADALGVPPRSATPWPMWLKIAFVALAIALPLLALSALVLWLGERAWLRVGTGRVR